MDEQNKNSEPESRKQPEMPDDLQQFTQWMTNYGRPALVGLAVAVVVLLGLSIWRNQKAEKAEASVHALFQGRAPEEFQQQALADPKAPTAPLALASAAAEFYAQGRYDEAHSAYERFLSSYPGHMMAPNAAVGVAASLEALDDFEAAARAYEAFAAANPGSALMPQAVMGAARCREQLGQFGEARALYEDFIVAHPEDSWVSQAESGLLFLKKAERARDAKAQGATSVVPEPEALAAEMIPAAAETRLEPGPAIDAVPESGTDEAAAEAKPRKASKKKKEAAPAAGDEPAGEPEKPAKTRKTKKAAAE